MREKIKTQKGFVQIPILLGILIFSAVATIGTIEAVKYKEEIKSVVANISAIVFSSKEEPIEEQMTEEELVIETEGITTNQVSDEVIKEELNQDSSTEEIDRLKIGAERANTEAEKLREEREEAETQRLLEEQQRQEELQKQQEAQKIAEEQKQQELEKEQTDEEERIANIKLVDEKLSQFISVIQQKGINVFSQAKNDNDSFISTARNKMNEYHNSSLIQQSGQQLINEVNNFSFIAEKLIDIDTKRINTLSSFLGTGTTLSPDDYPFSESEYENYLNQYKISNAQIESLIKTFASNEALVLDEKIQEAEEELLRKTKATEAMTKLNAIIQGINNQLTILDVQIQKKEDEIEQAKDMLESKSFINARLSKLIPQLNSLIDQWNTLIDKKGEISVIIYKLDDYFNYGTLLSAEDRAFLLSLGIIF